MPDDATTRATAARRQARRVRIVAERRARRETLTAQAVDAALDHLRAGDTTAADVTLRHAVHEGARPAEILRLALERTGGSL